MSGDAGYSIEDRLARVEVSQDFARVSVDRLAASVETLNDRFTKRPSWVVVWILAVSQALIGVLASALAVSLITR